MTIDLPSTVVPGESQTIAMGPSFPEQRWLGRDVALGLLVLFVIRVGTGFIPREMQRQWSVPIGVLAVGWLWFYPISVARLRGVELRWPTVRNAMYEALLAIPVLMGIWVCLAIIGSALYRLMPSTTIDDVNPFVERVVQTHDNPWLWALLFTGVAIAPIAEELFFRGMVYRYFKQMSPTWIAVVVQAVLFGFAHTFGVFHALLASLLGVSFALVYEWRKTIVAPMSLHVLQNLIAMTMTVIIGLMAANGPVLGVFGESETHGCRITQVAPDSSADVGGLQVGDVVFEFGGYSVADIKQLSWVVRAKQVGERVTLKYWRGDDSRTVEIVLKKRPQRPSQ